MNRSTFLYNCKQCLRWGKKNLKQIFCSRMIRKIYVLEMKYFVVIMLAMDN